MSEENVNQLVVEHEVLHQGEGVDLRDGDADERREQPHTVLDVHAQSRVNLPDYPNFDPEKPRKFDQFRDIVLLLVCSPTCSFFSKL